MTEGERCHPEVADGTAGGRKAEQQGAERLPVPSSERGVHVYIKRDFITLVYV